MFVKNFYIAMGQHFVGEFDNSIRDVTNREATVKNYSIPLLSSGANIQNVPIAKVDMGVYFSNSDEPTVYDQFHVPGTLYNAIDGFSAAVTLYEKILNAEYCEYICKYTITNESADPMDIKSIALCARCSTDVYLVERTVLDEPVTIPAGGVGQVTYTIRMNYPTT